METAIGAEEEKKRSVHMLDRLNYSIESVNCNLEQMTEIFYLLRAVNVECKKTFEESIGVNGFETSYEVLALTLRR